MFNYFKRKNSHCSKKNESEPRFSRYCLVIVHRWRFLPNIITVPACRYTHNTRRGANPMKQYRVIVVLRRFFNGGRALFNAGKPLIGNTITNTRPRNVNIARTARSGRAYADDVHRDRAEKLVSGTQNATVGILSGCYSRITTVQQSHYYHYYYYYRSTPPTLFTIPI